MFKFAIIPLFFLLSAVIADDIDVRTPCISDVDLTQDVIDKLKIRCYYGGSMKNYVDASMNEWQKIFDFADFSKNISFYMHGFTDTESILNNKTRILINTAILNTNKVNTCEYFWGAVSGDLNYFAVVQKLCPVGKLLGNFINGLMDLGWSSKRVILTGHSLGCHGIAYAANITRSKIRSLTCCDGAGPLYDFPIIGLDKNCADNVDQIFTNRALLGTIWPRAHTHWYANGGTFQPLCNLINPPYCSDHDSSVCHLAQVVSNPNSIMGSPWDPESGLPPVQGDPSQMVAMTWPASSGNSPGSYNYITTCNKTSIFDVFG